MGANNRSAEADSLREGLPAELQSRRDEILAQLGRILEDQHFKNSKHYTALLRYVVEQSLDGRSAHLKERVLGTEVFGRDPGYDTNQDPVVRTSACEIRKRLERYYLLPAHEVEVRIDLPAGSYVPEFRFPALPAEPSAPEPERAPAPAPESAALPTASAPWAWLRHLRYLWAAVPIAAVGIAIGLMYLGSPGRTLGRFWGPVWSSSHPVMLCVSESLPGRANPAPPPAAISASDHMANDRVPFADALATARIVGLLREHGKSYEIRKVENARLEDLRKGPVVLIGGLDNPWTMRLGARQRFTFERDEKTAIVTLRDSQNPSQSSWKSDFSKPYSETTVDYAIISRFVDPLTESVVVVVAGLGNDGAMAASEFVTESAHLKELARQAPAGWERKNLQVVIATTVVDREVGSPRILATWFW